MGTPGNTLPGPPSAQENHRWVPSVRHSSAQEGGQGFPIGHLRFRAGPIQVALHRPHRNGEPIGDLPIGRPDRDQVRDLPFPGRGWKRRRAGRASRHPRTRQPGGWHMRPIPAAGAGRPPGRARWRPAPPRRRPTAARRGARAVSVPATQQILPPAVVAARRAGVVLPTPGSPMSTAPPWPGPVRAA